MVAAVRHSLITNSTAALIPSGNPAIVCSVGQDYSFVTVKRTFIPQEIGNAAGQTQDTASNPTVGFLFAQFQGALIKEVTDISLRKDHVATHVSVFESISWGYAIDDTHAMLSNLSFRIVNYTDTAAAGFKSGYSSIYLLDLGGDAASSIEDTDRVFMTVELGNS
jgi:hypothetical protein